MFVTVVTDNAFFDWLMDILRALARLRTPVLDALMSAVTYLGDEMFFLFVALILFWCVDKKYGYRFLWIELIGNFCNLGLKVLFHIPRPWDIDPSFAIVEAARSGATGFSFPSGHTQGVAMLFTLLARRIRKGWAYAAAAFLVALVAFSRMYLGVHTLLDVGVGLILGVAVVLLGEWLLSKCGDGDRVYTLLAGIAAFLCVGAAAAGLLTVRENVSQCKDLCVLAGLSLALLFGGVIERRYVRFETEAVWWAQILKVAVGVALILGIKAGLKPLLALVSSSPVMDGVRYGLVGFIAIAVYPLTFRFLPKKKH